MGDLPASLCDWDGCDKPAVRRRDVGYMHTFLCRGHDLLNESLAEGGYSTVNPEGPRPTWHYNDDAKVQQ